MYARAPHGPSDQYTAKNYYFFFFIIRRKKFLSFKFYFENGKMKEKKSWQKKCFYGVNSKISSSYISFYWHFLLSHRFLLLHSRWIATTANQKCTKVFINSEQNVHRHFLYFNSFFIFFNLCFVLWLIEGTAEKSAEDKPYPPDTK